MLPDRLADLVDWRGFDREAYIAAYPDLARHGDHDIIAHYVRHGCKERRILRFHDPHARTVSFLCSLDGAPDEVNAALRLGWFAGCARDDAEQQGKVYRYRNGVLPDFLCSSATSYLAIGNSHSFAYSLPAFAFAGMAPVWAQFPALQMLDLRDNSREDYGASVKNCLSHCLGETCFGTPLLFSFSATAETFYSVERANRSLMTFSEPDFFVYLARSVAAYFDLLREIEQQFPVRIFVASAMPLSLSDDALKAGYLNQLVAALHSDLKPDEVRRRIAAMEHPDFVTRARHVRALNDMLRVEAARHRFGFVDLFAALTDGDGVLKPDYMYPGFGQDHHLNFYAISPVTVRTLKSAMFPG